MKIIYTNCPKRYDLPGSVRNLITHSEFRHLHKVEVADGEFELQMLAYSRACKEVEEPYFSAAGEDVLESFEEAGMSGFIVKVQISQYSTTGKLRKLIYDKARSFMQETDADEKTLNLMKDRPKAYFWAKWIVEELILEDEVGEQNW